MSATIESVCEARDNALLYVMELEDSLVGAATLAHVQELLAERDAALEDYATKQEAVNTFFDATPKPSRIKRLFTKN